MMVTLDCGEQGTNEKVVWNSVTMESGELCVMISGEMWMLTWSADSLDSVVPVKKDSIDDNIEFIELIASYFS